MACAHNAEKLQRKHKKQTAEHIFRSATTPPIRLAEVNRKDRRDKALPKLNRHGPKHEK